MNHNSSDLRERILAELARAPGRRANELADALGLDRHAVSRCLANELVGKVRQANDYRWRLAGAAPPALDGAAAGAATEIANLCRYYLECIGQDMDEGVSVFASNRYGEPDYAELSSLPFAVTDAEWFNEPGVSRVLQKVGQDKAKLVAWLGYPVRLRRHRTAKWEGFFVEPVFLWRITLPDQASEAPSVDDEAPLLNAKFLRSAAVGDNLQLAEEAARLSDELGLNVPLAELPEADELADRLARIRPDWDWNDALDPAHCSGQVPLADLTEAGIYNRAVVLPGERSPYTQGLETELKALAAVTEAQLLGTALGHWLEGDATTTGDPQDTNPLIEVLPMNGEQREAVRAAMSAQHTVVTGPPGTGKSQVVTNLLANAAWRGMKVLFASKNNKAVDVVEARMNGMGNRPVLLRLGSKEYQYKLAGYLTQFLAGTSSAEDRQSYDEGLARHKSLAATLAELDHMQQRTLDARNTVDRLDAEAEEARATFRALFHGIDKELVRQAASDIHSLSQAIDRADRDRQSWATRMVWQCSSERRLRQLGSVCEATAQRASRLGVRLPQSPGESDLAPCRAAVHSWKQRVAAAEMVLAYRNALEVLLSSPSFEEIAQRRADLAEQVAENSLRLWRDWVQLAPSRLSAAQRKDVADYAAVLQLMTGADAQRIPSPMRQRARALQSKTTELFACWAVTSLSARGRVPFEPGYFDLVVIDEASQCDIASVLPLLYRAKRSVIIGDPQQLRHISALSHPRDSELQHKHGLIETRVGWMYSISSVYDVAAGVVSPENIVNLRDHHRSHADIIEFSNRTFYEGRLRVATSYRQLKRPSKSEPGVVWQDVQGQVVRPAAGGALNRIEARAVLAALQDLLVTRRYEGTVGVVTPFRAQAQLLQELVAASDELAQVRDKAELLVDTVHRFQGDERDVMFFSPVASAGMPDGALSFLRSNGNLFNVAITRARGLLHVVGDQSAAASSGVNYLAEFARYVTRLSSAEQSTDDLHMQALGQEYPRVAKPEQVSDWERILYRALYAAGLRPIPQYSVEQYDLDFALVVGNRRLDIEVDGERYHRSWTGELCLRDQLRNQRMIELGWEVKRFWVYEIRDRLDECVGAVAEWAKAAEMAARV